MKLRIISINNFKTEDESGFITMEIILAFSLFAIFTISTFTLNLSFQKIKTWSVGELNILKTSVKEMDNYLSNGITGISLIFLNYGNFSKLISNESFNVVKSDLVDSWGSQNCLRRINFNESNIKYYSQGVFLGTGNKSTDIEVRNSIAYVTADSSTQAQPDFFIIDAHDYSNPKIISSLNTGPGLSAVAIAGPYAYVANTSSISQLQIIDIHNRQNPIVISQLKVPLPTASTTAPIVNSIFYKSGYIYLGTYKWDGPEFFIIDVSNPANPFVVGSYETSTLVNSIYINSNKAYLATSDVAQMMILDISNKNNPISVYSFSPTGWQTQEGKVIDYFEGILSLGRTVGGFNNISNHEIYTFSSSTYNDYLSKDIPGGVYGILYRNPYIFLITHSSGSEFKVWNSSFTNKIYEKALGSLPMKISCDWSNLYFATGDERGLSILTL